MEIDRRLSSLDQVLLRILSACGELTPLLVWHRLGEHDTTEEAVTEEEIQKRLESLAARGYVENVLSQGPKAGSAPLIHRIKAGGTGEI